MTAEQQAFQEHLRRLERIQARRFLQDPEPPTGFQDLIEPYGQPGRGELIQTRDFEVAE